MTTRNSISTDQAPAAIGAYSQAVRTAGSVYISGQIPLDPVTQRIVEGGPEAQIEQVFRNVSAVAQAAGGSLADIVKLTVYLTSLDDFPLVNEVMEVCFDSPYPARAAIGVASLPKDVCVEVEAIMAVRS